MEAAMKKFLLILCALMLLLSACAPDDGNLNEDETNEGIDEPIDGNNTVYGNRRDLFAKAAKTWREIHPDGR
jgi:protein involved in sex pheromone biosynthesis